MWFVGRTCEGENCCDGDHRQAAGERFEARQVVLNQVSSYRLTSNSIGRVLVGFALE